MTYSTLNSRFAAALITLGYERLALGRAGESVEVSFESDPCMMAELERQWRRGERASVPIVAMREASKARDWIVSRVVHGDHNADVEPKPESFRTRDIKFATCLVAQQFYLIKLDRIERLFFFDSGATKMVAEYREPMEGGTMFWQLKYIKNLEHLLREINLVLDKSRTMRNTCITQQHSMTRETIG